MTINWLIFENETCFSLITRLNTPPPPPPDLFEFVFFLTTFYWSALLALSSAQCLQKHLLFQPVSTNQTIEEAEATY